MMKNSKKNILILCLIMILMVATALVGCGNGAEDAASADVDKTTVEAQEESKEEKASEDSKDEETEAATKATEKATEVAKTKTSSNKNSNSKSTNKETAKQPTKSNTSATKATEAKKVCYITVEGHCTDKQIQLKGGESVYDILKQTGASISARNTGYGVYVEGINGRFEFDEGPTSGWVYTVNGSRINVSCSSYEVNSGDKIVWKYVTE